MTKITNHAKKRIQKRVGVTKGVADSYIKRVLKEGIKYSDAKSDLRDWMYKVYKKQKVANNSRYYAGKLYIFKDETLITVLNSNSVIENNLAEMVDHKVFAEYMRNRRKHNSKIRESVIKKEKETQKKILKEAEIAEAVHFFIKDSKRIVITSIKFVKPFVVKINYISNARYNDWKKFTDIQDYLKEYYGIASFLNKVKNANGDYVTIEEWEKIKESLS